MHTAGEPVRIVTGGYPELQGRTILEKRRDARENHDRIRRILMLEPRGHAGMYGVIPVAPSAPEADIAVLFMHNEGYSTMCGHATIAVGRWAVESGQVRLEGDCARFQLEVPCGVLPVEVQARNGRVVNSSFLSVPSFASHFDVRVSVPPFGDLTLDIAFGGAFYVILPSSQIGLPFWTTPLEQLVEAGTRITEEVRRRIPIWHPSEPDLGFLYGTILTDDASSSQPTYNLCVFAQGQIDRSPTGSGATARMALDYARGRIARGVRREYYGVSGVPFWAEIAEAEGSGLAARVRVRVGGASYVMGEAEFIVEHEDPLKSGFQLPPTFGALLG
jgi:trans-L-3-hydroxyproline dehydratase